MEFLKYDDSQLTTEMLKIYDAANTQAVSKHKTVTTDEVAQYLLPMLEDYFYKQGFSLNDYDAAYTKIYKWKPDAVEENSFKCGVIQGLAMKALKVKEESFNQAYEKVIQEIRGSFYISDLINLLEDRGENYDEEQIMAEEILLAIDDGYLKEKFDQLINERVKSSYADKEVIDNFFVEKIKLEVAKLTPKKEKQDVIDQAQAVRENLAVQSKENFKQLLAPDNKENIQAQLQALLDEANDLSSDESALSSVINEQFKTIGLLSRDLCDELIVKFYLIDHNDKNLAKAQEALLTKLEEIQEYNDLYAEFIDAYKKYKSENTSLEQHIKTLYGNVLPSLEEVEYFPVSRDIRVEFVKKGLVELINATEEPKNLAVVKLKNECEKYQKHLFKKVASNAKSDLSPDVFNKYASDSANKNDVAINIINESRGTGTERYNAQPKFQNAIGKYLLVERLLDILNSTESSENKLDHFNTEFGTKENQSLLAKSRDNITAEWYQSVTKTLLNIGMVLASPVLAVRSRYFTQQKTWQFWKSHGETFANHANKISGDLGPGSGSDSDIEMDDTPNGNGGPSSS